MRFGGLQNVFNLSACFIHALQKTDVASLDKVQFGGRADCFALIHDGLSGFLIATNNDDSQSRSIMTVGLAEFTNREFSDSIGCSYEDGGEWLCFDRCVVSDGDGCEFDHCGWYGERKNAYRKAWLESRDISIVDCEVGPRMRRRYIPNLVCVLRSRRDKSFDVAVSSALGLDADEFYPEFCLVVKFRHGIVNIA